MDESRKKHTVSREELIARLPIPGPGRPKETEEQKLLRKTRQQLIEEYKDALAEALPFVSPALIRQAITGNVLAIKELNDVIVEKAAKKTELTGKDGSPLVIQISEEIAKKNGITQNSESGSAGQTPV